VFGCPRADKHVLNAVWAAKTRSDGLDATPLSDSGRLSLMLRGQIHAAEVHLLRACAFALPAPEELPSALLPFFLRALEAPAEAAEESVRCLRAVLRTRQAAVLPAAACACAAVGLAARRVGWELPTDPAWHAALHPSGEDIAEAAAAAAAGMLLPGLGEGWPESLAGGSDSRRGGAEEEERRACRAEAEAEAGTGVGGGGAG